jgi:hypothetical protein
MISQSGLDSIKRFSPQYLHFSLNGSVPDIIVFPELSVGTSKFKNLTAEIAEIAETPKVGRN